MKLILLISALGVVCGRPQSRGGNGDNDSTRQVENPEKPVKVTTLPFYGGAHGQALQIIETADGRVSTQIVAASSTSPPEVSTDTSPESISDLSELEYPALPSKYETEYEFNLKNIHNTAVNIIKLQQSAKENGKLDDAEQIEYNKNMETLNASAKRLAHLQGGDDDIIDDYSLSAWFDRKKNDKKKAEEKKKEKDRLKEKDTEKEKEKEGGKEKEDEKEKEKEKENENEAEKEKEKEAEKEQEKEEEDDDDDDQEGNDTVIVNLPPDDASMAEAKPIGLAIAGAGGVAASKPVATAVVGPGGLAIARPVATAIAGVSPDQILIPLYADELSKPSKKKPSKDKKTSPASELLNKIINKYHHV